MMKRLILMRHAKSSWDNLHLSDHERSLNDRGRSDCPKISTWMSEHSYTPENVILSTATRCVETWEALALSADDVAYRDNLYHSSAAGMLQALQGAQGDVVMMIAHNPGIAEFAGRLHGKNTPQHPRFRDYPTAATTVIDFDVANWSDVSFGTGIGVNFVIPRDL